MNCYNPTSVIPVSLRDAVYDIPCWFVIGGQAVRCFSPYRPTQDVDFGVHHAADMEHLVKQLGDRGCVKIVERTQDTIHLQFNGIKVSVFVLELLTPFVKERRLTPTGILATKLHTILDRGLRRDFFDLYVTMQHHSLGIAECLIAIRKVFKQDVNESLLLRALTFFDDAEKEAPLPGEGSKDWSAVKEFFLTRVGNLLIPPSRKLKIQNRKVDVRQSK